MRGGTKRPSRDTLGGPTSLQRIPQHPPTRRSIAASCLLGAATGLLLSPQAHAQDESALNQDTFEKGLLDTEIPLVSGAAFREQSLEEAPSGVLIISARDIRRSGARTLGEALDRCAGIEVSSANQAAIRGLGPTNLVGGSSDASRVLLLIDGVRMNDVFSDSFTVGIERGVDDIARIEVMKGPGSALYGTNAFAGVIQVVTLRGSDDEGIGALGRIGYPPEASASGYVRGVSDSNEGALAARVVTQLPAFDTPTATTGESSTSSSQLASTAIEVRANASRGAFSVQAGYAGNFAAYLQYFNGGQNDGQNQDPNGNQNDPNAPGGTPTPPPETTPTDTAPAPPKTGGTQARYAMTDASSDAAPLSSAFEPATTNGVPEEIATQQRHQGWGQLQWEQGFSPRFLLFLRTAVDMSVEEQTARQLRFHEGRGTVEGRLRFMPSGLLRIVAGGEARLETVILDEKPSAIHVVAMGRDVVAGYGQVEIGPFLSTTITAGVRVERLSVSAQQSADGSPPPGSAPSTSSSGSGDNLLVYSEETASATATGADPYNTLTLPEVTLIAPRLGAVSTLRTGTTLKAFIGAAAQMPSLSVLFYDSPVDNGLLLANPNLKPEQLFSMEVEALQTLPFSTRGRLNVFQNEILGLIAPKFDSAKNELRFQNRYNARLRGLEASLDSRPTRWLTLIANATLLDARTLDNAEYLPLIPNSRLHASAAITSRRGASGWVGVSWTASRKVDNGSDSGEELASALRFDARADVPLGRSWDLALNVRNLLGTSFEEFGENQSFLTGGREIWIELGWHPPPTLRAPPSSPLEEVP